MEIINVLITFSWTVKCYLQLKRHYILSIWYLQTLTHFFILIFTQLWDAETITPEIHLYLMWWENGANWELKFAIQLLNQHFRKSLLSYIKRIFATLFSMNNAFGVKLLSRLWLSLAICVNVNSSKIFMILWILYILATLVLNQLHTIFYDPINSLSLVQFLIQPTLGSLN